MLGGASCGTSSKSSASPMMSRSRLAGASAKTSSFLASLNPARWGRSSVPVPAHSAHSSFFKVCKFICNFSFNFKVLTLNV